MERFSFRTVRQPTWEVELPDGCVLHIKQPTQGGAVRMKALYDDLSILKDKEQAHKAYDLMAAIMSENEEGITLTGKELHVKHHIADWMLVEFVKQYLAFIEEIKSIKN